MAFYLNVCHIYWLILSLSITTYLLASLRNRWTPWWVAFFLPQRQHELLFVVRRDILNVVVERCLASTTGGGSPCLYYCCPLVSTTGMKIFLHFGNLITLSLPITSFISTLTEKLDTIVSRLEHMNIDEDLSPSSFPDEPQNVRMRPTTSTTHTSREIKG